MTYRFDLLIIYYALIIANIIYGFRSNENKLAIKINRKTYDFGAALAFCLLAFLLVLILIDNDNPDYFLYNQSYVIGTQSPDQGYELLKQLAKNLGLDFAQFRASVYIIFYMLIWFGVKHLGVNKNFTFGLYAIFPFVYDAIQIRSFLAAAVIIFSIHYLMDQRKIGLIKYLIGVIIATSLHSVSIIYASFLLVRLDKNEKIKQRLLSILFTASLVITLISLFGRGNTIITYLINVFSMNTSEGKFLFYNKGINFNQIMLLVIQQLCFLFSAKFLKDSSEINGNRNEIESIRIINLIYSCNLAVCCSLPLLLVTSNFYRLFRNIHIVNYGMAGIICDIKTRDIRCYLGVVLFIAGFVGNMVWNFNIDTAERIFWVFFN